jgi:hypothetical protein
MLVDEATVPPPTQTPKPTATHTPLPRPTNTPAPAPTATPRLPQIHSFQVWPSKADPGDIVTLTWQASGDRATICPNAERYMLFTLDDCRSVNLSGTTTFTIPQEAGPDNISIKFALSVETDDTPQPITERVYVALKCHVEWFFADEWLVGGCPMEPIYTHAAAQHFERGMMIWMEQPGEYVILDQNFVYTKMQKQLDRIKDPLEIIRNTSADIPSPPQGLYAPESGFGLVWRGDVSYSPGYRQALGWALEPEFGYEAVYQCDSGYVSSGIFWQFCYLKRPDGEVVFFHPLGGWHLLSERP